MAEIMSIAVAPDDQWLVVNGRPVEYYSSDTAFVDGKKVWASERAARRLAEALAGQAEIVDFVTPGFPDALVFLPTGESRLVHGAISLHQLGLEAVSPTEIQEDELVILARELISRAKTGGSGVEPVPEPASIPA